MMRRSRFLLCGCALVTATPAFAADPMPTVVPPAPQSEPQAEPRDAGDIVVTATRTGATRLQDTPLAVTAFNVETLERAGVKDVRDLTALTPNLQVTQNGAFSQIYIRGIGSNNVFAGSDPSSTIHLDGIYLARPASYLSNFLDVERIEVLRGPQGTLYGRNSVGGTVNVVSRKPGDTLTAKLQATYGNYDFTRLEGYFSTPIADGVAASVSVIGSRRDGYLRNVGPQGGRIDSEGTIGFRSQLRLTPSPKLEVLLRGEWVDSDDTMSGYTKLLQTVPDPVANSVLGDFRAVALNIQTFSKRRQWGTSAEIGYDLGGGLSLKSLTGFRGNRMQTATDTDATTLNTRRTDQFEKQHQFSQEVNLLGKVGDLSFILGGYYFDENIQPDTSVTTFATNLRVNYKPTVNTEAVAAFAQGTFALTDWLSLTAGIRYTRENKRFDQIATNFNTVTNTPMATFPRTYSREGVYKAWTPKFGIELRPSNGLLLYASATKGFKSGGFNLASANPAQGFAPETLWSYEGGAKLDLFERVLQLNVAYFHYDYKDLQVQSFLTPGVIDITNASDAKVDGLEVESVLRPTRWLQIGANLAYLDARYDNYPSALAPGNIPFDASGKRLNLSPKWTKALWAQLDVPTGDGRVFARGEYSHRTRQFFTALNTGLDQQAPYSLVNASIGYAFPGEHFELLVYGRNLADKDYVTSTASFAAGIVGRVGEPRTYGLRAIARF
ncbi:TonB-dependent receptor [Sphingomonas sp.]|uniref:TonB-dependent receptor n=1 Tax=Sphingomonas sp. TaxID=28214 RepID=UPI002DD62D45|nr:TonB-dependent receptor [Sphingomonas sp.]